MLFFINPEVYMNDNVVKFKKKYTLEEEQINLGYGNGT